MGSFSAPSATVKRRMEAEGGYDHGAIHLRAEQIWARDGTLERRGGYALGACASRPAGSPWPGRIG